MTDANANIQINGSVAPIIEAELAKLNASLQKTISNLQLFNSSSKSLSTGTDTIGVSLNGISKGLKDTSHHLQQLTIRQSALSAGFRGNSKAIDETIKQIDRLRKANADVNRTGIKFDLAPLQRYQTQLEALNKASTSITTANKAATFKQIGAGYEGLSQKLNYASQRLTFGLSLPIAGFLRTGFNSLKSMSTQTIRLNKLLDDAYSSSAKLGSGVMSLDQAMSSINKNLDGISGKWGVSRELLQGIAGDFAEIGISSTSALAILTQTTVEFEKLGNVDITQAGETVRALYQNMARIRRDKGLGVTSDKDIEQMMAEVRGAVALFNYAENKTSLSLKNMAEAFPEVASAATSFGLDMATTSALLVPMIGAGIKTGTAANSIKISLQGLVNVTKKAKMDLEGLNKTFGTDIAVGGEIGAEGLQKLANAYTRLKNETNDAQVLSTFGDFFGKRQAPRFEIAIQQASQFTEAIKNTASAESQLLSGLEGRINASLTLNKMNTVQIKDIKDIANLTKLAQERDSSGNFTARANLIQKAQRDQVKNLTEQQTLGKSINNISTEYGKIQVGGAFGSALTGQTLVDELKKAEQSLEVKYGKARENIKSISRELTVVLADILNVLNPIIQKIAKAFQEMSSPVKKIIGLVLVLAAVIGPMVRTFAAGFQLVGAISRGFGKITEIKSLGKSTVELNKELLKTNDLAFRIGGNFSLQGKNGSVFTNKKNIKSLQTLSAIQEKEDSGQALTKLDKSEKKIALTKLAGKRAVREGTALRSERDFSTVDLSTEQALNKIYEPQDEIKRIVDETMAKAEEAVVKAKGKSRKRSKTAEDFNLKEDAASSRPAGVTKETPAAAPVVPATVVPTPTRTSGAAPVSNIYEPILKQILTVLKGIEVCACAGKTAMTGPTTPPTSGPTASPRGPTPVSPAGGSTAMPAPSSSPDLSKLSDEELTAGKARIEAEAKQLDEESKKTKENIDNLQEQKKKLAEERDKLAASKAKLFNKDGGVGSKKYGPEKPAGPKAVKEKIFKPLAKFGDKLDAETMALMQQAGVAEATSAQGVGVAFDLTKQHLINLFEALGKEVPEGLKKITQIVDKATGEAIRITPASLAKIKTSIESGKLQSLVNEGVGSTGNRSLNEAIRGATGTAKQKATSDVTYSNVRSGRDRDETDFVGTSLRTGKLAAPKEAEQYQKLFEVLRKLSVEAGATQQDINNLDIQFKIFLQTLEDLKRINPQSVIPDIKTPAQLSNAIADTANPKSRIRRSRGARAGDMSISEQQLQESLGPIPSDLRVDPKVQSALEASLPKNRNYYRVKRQEYSLNEPAGAERVSSGASTEGKKFGEGPDWVKAHLGGLAGKAKKPLDKLSDAEYEKFANARKKMIEAVRESMRVQSEMADPADEVVDFRATKGPRRADGSGSVAEPKGAGKRSGRVIAEDEVQGMLDKRRTELQAEYNDPALVERLMKRFEATTRDRVGRANQPNVKAAATKAAKEVVDDGPALSSDEYIAQKKAKLEAELKEEKRKERNAKAKAKRDAEKAAKAAGGGGAAGSTSFGGVDDPFAAVMGGPRARGPRMAKIPGVSFVDKGAITGGVTNVYEEIRQALNIPVEIMNQVISELKEKHNVITGVGNKLKTEINGDLDGVVKAIKGTLGAADMTVENVKGAIVAQRTKIGNLRGAAKASTSGKSSESGLIGSGMSRDDRLKYAQEIKSKIIAEGKASVDFQNHEIKTLEYIARAFRKGAKGNKAQLEQIILAELKALEVTVEKAVVEEAVKPINDAESAVKSRSSRKSKAIPTVGEAVPQLALGVGRKQAAQAKLAAAALGTVGDTVHAVAPRLMLTAGVGESAKRAKARMKLERAAAGSRGTVYSPIVGEMGIETGKRKGFGSSIGNGIRDAASQGINSLTMGLGPLGAIADGPLNKIVNVMLKFKKVSMAASLPILLIVGTIMLLKATFAAFGDKAGTTMKNFKNVMTIIKNVIGALKRAFFDFFASLFGPAKDSEGAMGNVGKKVEAVSNIVARLANAFNRVFKSTILPAIYSILSGLSLLIRGFIKIFGGIFNIVKGLVQKLTGQGDAAGKSFDKGLSMLKDGFFKVFKGIVKFLAIPLKIIINAFMKLVEFIVQLFEFLIIGVVNLIRLMVKGIINVSFTIVKAYVLIIDKVIELFVILEKAAINIALATVKGVVNAFFGIIKAAVFIVQKVIDLFALIPAGVGKGFSLLTGLIAGLLRKIAEKLPNIFGIKDKINGVADAIEGAGDSAEEMGNKAKGALNGILDPVTKGIQSGQNSILDFIDKIGGAALSNISKLNGLGDFILKALGGVQNKLLDGVNSAADAINRLVGSASDGINKLREGIINWIESIADGDDIVKGIGDKMKKEVEDTLDDIADPQAAIAAGKIIAAGIQKGLKDLKMNFYDKVTDSLGESLKKLKDGMKDALGKQKDEQLKFFDDQVAAIDALAAAEEELTAKKKYEEDKRDRIAERALQKDAYRKNRALAIYEGRVEDARTMSLQEEKDNKDFNKEIEGMDKDRKSTLQGQNRDAAKAAIERQKKEASDQFDMQIKNFEDLIENIGKYGTLSKDDLQAQFTALNEQAVKTSGSMKQAFQDYYTALPGIIQANTDPTVGFFTAGIDTLIAAAAGKYGSAQGVSDPTTMLGLTNQMLVDTGDAYTAGFRDTIVPNYKTGQDAIAGIATDFADPTKANSLSSIYKLAISNATAAITAEFLKMKTESSAAFADVIKGINGELKNLAIAQAIVDAKAEIAAAGGSTTTGGTNTGTPTAPTVVTTPPAVTAPPASSSPSVPVENRFGPANIAKAAFEKALGADGLFKDGDSNDYIKKAKEALSYYGYSGFTTATGDFGTNTIKALKAFQKDYTVGGNNDGNLGVSAANALGLFGNAGVQKKYNGGMIKKMMSGGVVPGFSSQGVPAVLHGGEYVISSKAVQNLGLSVLAQLNGLKNGVPSINVPKPKMPNSSGMNMNVTSHSTSETTQNYNFYVDNFIGEDQWFESMMKDYNIKVVPNNQKAAGLESRVIRTYNGINRGM